MSDDLQETDIRSFAALLPSDRNQTQGFLTFLSGPEIGRTERLEPGETHIGRSRDMEFVFNEDGLSRQHARIRVAPDGGAWISDCASTNGTLVNGTLITGSIRLQDGDRIQLGVSAILKFSYQDHLEESFQRTLYDSAVRDALTGIYNKRFLDERVQQEFSYALRHDVPYSLLLIDIDHFKQVNDKHGHATGDFVLHSVAAAMDDLRRSEELLARYGGEEFAILMLGSGLQAALQGAERIRARIEELRFSAPASEVRVTVSVGVASTEDATFATAAELLEAADEQLYSAKRGRNRICGPTPSPPFSASA